MATELPVVVEVLRDDGTQELVQVGTARRDGGVFVLDLRALHITPSRPEPPPPQQARAPPPVGGTLEDLEYIAQRARRTLADPSRARWHAQEREILTQVERELERRRPEVARRSR
ncbi:MAG: hypothetical protein AMXMBFR34_18990 [Myxococcaceae bacterium]